MKKMFIVGAVVLVSSCSCICPTQPLRAISNEKNTNIYLNNEYLGADSTYAIIPQRLASTSTLSGEKKGCIPAVMPIEYVFDWSVVNIIDPRNIVRLITWNVYKVDNSKDMYNITPRCN